MPHPSPASVTGPLPASGVPAVRPPAAPWSIFWIAFLVRVLYLTLAHTYRFRLYGFGLHFQFGWEMGRIARALVTGYGYADPFSGHTGPTAWVTPLYPLLLAGVFKLFGVYTLTSAWVILTLNSLFSALTTRTVWEIALRCFNLRVARWSACIWALYPAAMQYAVRWVWEMTLTTLLFTALLVLALRMRRVGEPSGDGSQTMPPSAPQSALPSAPASATMRRWAVFGLLSGLIALSNPSLLPFFPLCGLWILMGTYRQPRQAAGVLLSIVVCVSLVAPWSWRNWRTFHTIIPLRSNFGAELYMGNGPGAFGMLMEYDHPNQSMHELDRYERLGEIRYSQIQGERTKALIRQQPVRFLVLSIKRFYYYWMGVPRPFQDHGVLNEYGRDLNFAFASLAGLLGLGLALYRRTPASPLFALAFLVLPAPYYLVSVQARFRHPLEPLITILAVYLFQSAGRSPRGKTSLR
jgi:4-amino-4-deoxy-L-arabinose transferase-like glycosyltransferase